MICRKMMLNPATLFMSIDHRDFSSKLHKMKVLTHWLFFFSGSGHIVLHYILYLAQLVFSYTL